MLIPLLLGACGAPATDAGPTTTPSDGPTAASMASASVAASPSQMPAATPTLDAPADSTFTTPDGSLSFAYPAGWSVNPVDGQENAYAVVDAAGSERATLRDRLEGLAMASVITGVDIGFRTPVPGIKGPAGQGASVVVQGTWGQAVGGQAAVFALSTDGSADPIGRAAIEVPAGGYYVIFAGLTPLETPTVPPSEEELVSSVKAFAKSPDFAETARVISSLTLHADKVQAVGCFGARYKYRELNGISCNDAKGTLDRVEKTGTGVGARSMETADYMCFYASAGEKQSGQADVICRNKANPDGISFDAWLK